MADTLIQCPACRFQLAVPPEMMGQAAQCPQCGATFTAPTSPSDSYGERPPLRPRGPMVSTTGPAMAWIIVTIISMVLNGFILLGGVATISDPAGFEKGLRESLAKQQNGNDPEMQQMADTIIEHSQEWGQAAIIYGGGWCALGLLTILAAIQFARQRTYWFVMLVALLNLLNIGNVCGLWFVLPILLWVFISLLSSSVRAAFR